MDQPHEPGPRAPICTTVRSCRSCGREGLQRVLDLGRVPLANALLERPDAEEQRFPLTLAFCPGCSLVQILETIDPEVLFGHYLYFSSFSRAMLAHARAEAEMLIERRGLDGRSLVIEVASNDGYLLKNFVARGIPVLGIEPARNIAQVAISHGVPTRCEFFGERCAEQLRREGLAADCVLGNNVLAHVADLNGFVRGAAILLKPDGVCVFEFPYLGDLIEHLEFDTIYHEHLCYFSLHAIDALFARHALRLVDVERLSVHGGSLRVFGEPAASGARPSERVTALLAHERASGMTGPDSYARFADRVRGVVRELMAELEGRRARGQRLAAYGASAKGSTLMNYAGIDRRHLEYVCDVSTAKQGRYTPGNRLPIVSPDRLGDPATRPDAVLLLSWNWAREIAEQQSSYLREGGEFIVPIPSVRTLRAGDISALGVIGGPTPVGGRA